MALVNPRSQQKQLVKRLRGRGQGRLVACRYAYLGYQGREGVRPALTANLGSAPSHLATSISRLICKERATRKNSQLAAAQGVALKMGRRLRCSSVTSRSTFMLSGREQKWKSIKVGRDAPSYCQSASDRLCRRPILNATTSPLYVRRCTRPPHPLQRPCRRVTAI